MKLLPRGLGEVNLFELGAEFGSGKLIVKLEVLFEEVFDKVVEVNVFAEALLLERLNLSQGLLAELSSLLGRFARVTSFFFHTAPSEECRLYKYCHVRNVQPIWDDNFRAGMSQYSKTGITPSRLRLWT